MSATRPPDGVLYARALLLDLDGVLVDSAAAVEQAWTQWAREVGLDLAAVHGDVHGRRATDTIRELAPHLDAEDHARRVEDLEIGVEQLVRDQPGARRLLRSLPSGRWAVVTSGSRRLATGRVAALGTPAPPVFVTADDVTEGKPAPEPYLRAAALLGVAPADCVVVEDAPAGVAAASAAGIRVVAVTTTHDADAFPVGVPVVADISRLDVRDAGHEMLTIRHRGPSERSSS